MTDSETRMNAPDLERLKLLIPQLETLSEQVGEGKTSVFDAVTELCEMGVGVNPEGTDVFDYRDRPKEDLVRGIRYAIERMQLVLTPAAKG